MKSDFVSNVSHELRTPLSLIRLYAETLEMGRLTSPEKYQEYYRIIRKESERLTALINNILDFSRIEAGKKEYDFCETDLANWCAHPRFLPLPDRTAGLRFEEKIDERFAARASGPRSHRALPAEPGEQRGQVLAATGSIWA